MTSKKLGALLRSVPPATARAEASGDLSASIIAPEPAALPRAARPAAMEPEVPLQVLIPKHVRTQLGVRAAEEGRSLRELVLQAIRKLGIEVSDPAIRGKRGRRA